MTGPRKDLGKNNVIGPGLYHLGDHQTPSVISPRKSARLRRSAFAHCSVCAIKAKPRFQSDQRSI
jgi:hypothetical protein